MKNEIKKYTVHLVCSFTVEIEANSESEAKNKIDLRTLETSLQKNADENNLSFHSEVYASKNGSYWHGIA